MYVHTRMLKATTESGWWNLITDCSMQFNIELDPTTLSPSGASRVRTWMRKGFCDRPTGRLAAYWTMLMYAAGARYVLTTTRGSGHARIIASRKESLELFGKVQEFEAHRKLFSAAFCGNEPRPPYSGDEFSITPIGDTPTPDRMDQVKLEMYGQKSAFDVRFYAKPGYSIAFTQKFVEVMGHPIPNLREALGSTRQLRRFELELDHVGRPFPQRPRSAQARTITTIREIAR